MKTAFIQTAIQLQEHNKGMQCLTSQQLMSSDTSLRLGLLARPRRSALHEETQCFGGHCRGVHFLPQIDLTMMHQIPTQFSLIGTNAGLFEDETERTHI